LLVVSFDPIYFDPLETYRSSKHIDPSDLPGSKKKQKKNK